jgi:hypothetical protein
LHRDGAREWDAHRKFEFPSNLYRRGERLDILAKALSHGTNSDQTVTVSRLTSLSKMIPQPTRTFGGLPHCERMPAKVEKQASFFK